jgi:hypothetical protein
LIDKVLTTLLEGRRFEFSVERAIFLTVLHRLLPDHGLAGRGASERPAGRGHAFRSPHQQGPH